MSVEYVDFPYKVSPFRHQHDAFLLDRDKTSHALFMDLGTGKTKVALDTAAYLYLKKAIQGLVVVAPKGVYRNWVRKEIPEHLSDAVPRELGSWSSHMLKDDLADFNELFKPASCLKILAINIEALSADPKKIRAGKCEAVVRLIEFLKKFPSLLVVDESTTIKNPKAHRTSTLIAIGNRFAPYRRILSGAPMPNGPLDIFSQAEFLKKGLLGYENFYAFRNRFAVMQPAYGAGGKTFPKIVGYRDHEALKDLINSFAFVVKKTDCLDLPEKLYQTVDVELGPKQKKAYNSMLDESFIQLDSGERVTANLVLTKLVKLHQVACGFIQTGPGSYLEFDEPNDRLSSLIDDLEQVPDKAIIWCDYIANIEQVLKAIREKFGHSTVVDYYGATSDNDREKAKDLFQDPSSSVKYIVSNPATGKFGNTWTMGTTVFYYSNSYDLEKREQSEDRAHRIGQRFNVLYVDLVAQGTVDERILKVLKNKKKLSEDIVVSNWKWLLGSKVA